MPIETRVNPPAASSASDSGVTESGFASVVTSASGASPKRSRMPSSILTRSPDLSIVGVPPPTKTVEMDGDSSPRTALREVDLKERRVCVGLHTDRHALATQLGEGVGVEVAVAASHRAEGTWT